MEINIDETFIEVINYPTITLSENWEFLLECLYSKLSEEYLLNNIHLIDSKIMFFIKHYQKHLTTDFIARLEGLVELTN